MGSMVATRCAGPGGRVRSRVGRARRLLGLGIVLGGVAVTCNALADLLAVATPQVRGAVLGGLLAALATALGTLPVLLRQQHSDRAKDLMLGFGAGVMLAACSFSLIIPGLEAARTQGLGSRGAAGLVGAAILLGAGFMMALDRWLPHERFIRGVDGPRAALLRRGWLFALAIILHNIPEGLAIGVAFAGSHAASAQALTAGIAIQDVPEGLAVALALRVAGHGRLSATAVGVASGLVEPVGALLGVTLVGLGAVLLPLGLAVAAGAMLYVISHEIIPQAHRAGHERWATGGLMLGFVLMLVLDVSA